MVARKLVLLAVLVVCLAVVSPAWAGTLTYEGTAPQGQGELNFTPGVGNTLTIGADGKGNLGALVTDLFFSIPQCAGGDCAVQNGYLTLTTGKETSGSSIGGAFSYNFGAGGALSIVGGISTLGIANGSTLLTLSFLNGATFSGGGTSGVFQGNVNLASIVLNPVIQLAVGGVMFTGGSNDELSISLDNACGMGGKCFGPLLSSTTGLQYVPEPATLSVLGIGLFASGAGLRKKMKTS